LGDNQVDHHLEDSAFLSFSSPQADKDFSARFTLQAMQNGTGGIPNVNTLAQ
jgi:hypothetical protein